MIKQYDLVKTLVQKRNHPAGTYGVAVEIIKVSNDGHVGCIVELWDQYNYPYDSDGYDEDELHVLTPQEEKELLAKTDIKKILEMHG